MNLQEYIESKPQGKIADIFGTRVRVLRDNSHPRNAKLGVPPGSTAADDVKEGTEGTIIGEPVLIGVQVYWEVQWDGSEEPAYSSTSSMEVVL